MLRLLLFALTCAAAVPAPAHACSCEQVPPGPAYDRWIERQFDDAWAVFAAEIIGADRFTTTLRVAQAWKGDVGRIVSVVKDTFRDTDGRLWTSSCNWHARDAERRYLVFAVRDGARRVKIQSCSPTTPRSRSGAIEALLDRIAPPRVLEAALDDVERILADLERDLAPIAAWRSRAEDALRPHARTPQVDAPFLALRLELKDIVRKLARRFESREFQMLVAPHGAAGQHQRRASGLQEGPSAADVQRAETVVAFMKQRGVWPQYAEGDTYFYVNESALLDWFGGVVSREIREFLSLWSEERESPLAEDGSLMVSLDAVERRMAAAERFLADYPDSPVREPMRAVYQQRLAVYLGGLPNTPAFDIHTGVMNVPRRQRLEAYAGAHPGTESARLVEQYLGLLRADGFRREPQVDHFLRALWDLVDSLQLRY